MSNLRLASGFDLSIWDGALIFAEIPCPISRWLYQTDFRQIMWCALWDFILTVGAILGQILFRQAMYVCELPGKLESCR